MPAEQPSKNKAVTLYDRLAKELGREPTDEDLRLYFKRLDESGEWEQIAQSPSQPGERYSPQPGAANLLSRPLPQGVPPDVRKMFARAVAIKEESKLTIIDKRTNKVIYEEHPSYEEMAIILNKAMESEEREAQLQEQLNRESAEKDVLTRLILRLPRDQKNASDSNSADPRTQKIRQIKDDLRTNRYVRRGSKAKLALNVAIAMDNAISHMQIPKERAALKPLPEWIEKAGGKDTWTELYDDKRTHCLVQAYINKR